MRDIDPFEMLGLGPTATATDVRRARRELAKEAHPDRGGSHARMQELNEAASAALAMLTERTDAGTREDGTRAAEDDADPNPSGAPESVHHLRVTDPDVPSAPTVRRVGRWLGHDDSSFVVHCLPVEAFEALLVVASWIGEIVDDDPPYRLDLLLNEPGECFCRLDLVPDAGASTVSISLAHIDGAPWPPPTLDEVRDAFVAGLNELG